MGAVSIDMHPMAIPALRAVLIERIEAVTKSLEIYAPTAQLTLAEFEAMEPDAWPTDLRTVLVEQLQLGLSAIDVARERYIRDGR